MYCNVSNVLSYNKSKNGRYRLSEYNVIMIYRLMCISPHLRLVLSEVKPDEHDVCICMKNIKYDNVASVQYG